VVLELCELGDELRRQQVRARRQDLTQLAERRTELLERLAETLRAPGASDEDNSVNR